LLPRRSIALESHGCNYLSSSRNVSHNRRHAIDDILWDWKSSDKAGKFAVNRWEKSARRVKFTCAFIGVHGRNYRGSIRHMDTVLLRRPHLAIHGIIIGIIHSRRPDHARTMLVHKDIWSIHLRLMIVTRGCRAILWLSLSGILRELPIRSPKIKRRTIAERGMVWGNSLLILLDLIRADGIRKVG